MPAGGSEASARRLEAKCEYTAARAHLLRAEQGGAGAAMKAIDAARAIGIEQPKVAILSATEEVDPVIPSTLDAAALCKMADRGQIKGGLLDGPLAFDLAVSPDAVAAKGLTSPVAGDADVLIVPTLEAGNMLAKQLDYLAGASAAGIVLGASVPIILTSRADTAEERLASCAFAALVSNWYQSVP